MRESSIGQPPSLEMFARQATFALNRFLLSPPWTRRPICTLAKRSSPRSICSPGSDTSPSDGSSCEWAHNLLNTLVPPVLAEASHKISDKLAPKHDQTDAPFSSIYPAANRIVAIGDVHGDVNAMRTALRNANVIDDSDAWVGGETVLVQVGDQLDRGNRERAVYDLLFKLQDNAPASGGAVHILLGNHEIMNSRLDFRYVSSGGFDDFHRDGGINTVFGKKFKPRLNSVDNKAIRLLPENMRARARSLVAGGPLAMELSQRARLGVIVGDNLFIHAGLSPKHFKFSGKGSDATDVIHQLNLATRKFLQRVGDYPTILSGKSSPVWMRDYSRPGIRNNGPECDMLNETLNRLGIKRMIVGHTPQAEGINSACGGKVWRIDTGMCAAYGGVPEAIEIGRRGNVKIFSCGGVVQGSARFK